MGYGKREEWRRRLRKSRIDAAAVGERESSSAAALYDTFTTSGAGEAKRALIAQPV